MLLHDIKPDVVLTGTSTPTPDSVDAFEQSIVYASRTAGIRCVAVLDFWAHYVERFSIVDPKTHEVLKRFAFPPDAIGVMGERARDKMLSLGFPPELLHVTGNPEFNITYEQAGHVNLNANLEYPVSMVIPWGIMKRHTFVQSFHCSQRLQRIPIHTSTLSYAATPVQAKGTSPKLKR